METSDEVPGLNGFGPVLDVVGPEIVVAGAMLDHMAGSGEDRGGEGADRLFRAISGAQATELRFEIAVVFAAAAQAHWIMGDLEARWRPPPAR